MCLEGVFIQTMAPQVHHTVDEVLFVVFKADVHNYFQY